MEIEKINNFVVHTKGHCFICLNKVPLSGVKLDPEGLSSSSFYSLKSLSRHLKMNMGKVFNDEELISQTLLEKVQGSTLKVELCRECRQLNQTFKGLSRTLEKVEMEITSCLRLIKKKLNEAEKEHFRKLYVKEELQAAAGVGGPDGKLKIVEALRTETIQKCSNNLSCDRPRVKIQKLTMKQVNVKILKTETKSHNEHNTNNYRNDLPGKSEQGPEVVDVKLEASSSADARLEDDWDMDDAIHYPHESGENIRDSEDPPSIPNEVSEPPVKTGRTTINPKTGKHKCSICSTEFTTSTMFNAHYTSVHLNVRFKCKLCDKTFNYQRSYSQHHKTAHVGVRFKCQLCGKLFTRNHMLQRHMQTKCCRM